MFLENIDSPAGLKELSMEKLPYVAEEIREALVKRASTVGGHLASNLGIVEITIALHYVFDSPSDKIIFDVSHQCYPHKMLTGRKNAYLYEENYGDVTGFTNPLESEHDFFNIGHTSTSISLAYGFAKARDLKDGRNSVVAVIGDAALDGGQAFESLNSASELNTGLIIVVNDNEMSIPENHGSLSAHLKELKASNGKSGNNFFRALGYDYRFVQDGHDINALVDAFKNAKDTQKPVVIHCCTVKGKGFAYAEQNPERWHHAHPFTVSSGEFNKAHTVPKENYGSLTGTFLEEKIKTDPLVVAMTASVPACFGFNAERRMAAGKQFVDVGIAEQNLVTMAAAIAKGGCKPVTITESSFYQRAYDQIEQEMCRNKCPVTMLVAFSGIYAHNDDTHIGIFDISLFGNIPNLIYLAPSNKQEYFAMLEWSMEQKEYPVAIRIPWNGVHSIKEDVPVEYGKTKYWIRKYGSKVAIIAVGDFYQLGEQVVEKLNNDYGIDATLIDPMFISDCDTETLRNLQKGHGLVCTLEDGIVAGGFGAKIAQFYSATDMKVLNFGFGMDIPVKFTAEELLEKNGLLPDQIAGKIGRILVRQNRDKSVLNHRGSR